MGVGDQESISADSDPGNNGDAVVQFKALIRQLPPRRHINTLVSFFFAELAWQYEIVDEHMFRQQLREWEQVSYAACNKPFGLSPATRQFPALLFQVIAQALLFQPMSYDRGLDDLLYAPGMDLSDLAAEFSDTGSRVISIFDVTDATFVKVQSGFLQASFQKTTGSVAHAWHTLGRTIRDAQELGLHCLTATDELVSFGSLQEAQRLRMGRKLWFLLHLWDAHMAVVLGRPMTTQFNADNVPSPDHETNDGEVGSDAMHPTPFNMILCGYHAAYKYLQEIHSLASARQDIRERVEDIHSAIMANVSHIPSWARLQEPHPNSHYPWLPVARETLHTEIYFSLLALHRPSFFSHSQSRTQAFMAAIQILESQSRLFGKTEPGNYPAFTLVFATFDAAVIVAATHILFSGENEEHVEASLKGVRWALQRLYTMRARNNLASSAYDMLRAIYGKLLNSLSAEYTLAAWNLDFEGSLMDTMEQSLSNQTKLQESEANPQCVDKTTPPQPFRDLNSQDFATDLLSTETDGDSSNLFEQAVLDDEFWRIITDVGR